MFRVNVKTDIKEVTRYLTRVQKKQIPFAAAKALTKTAQEVKKGLVNEMKQSFDRPTKFTLNSLYVKPAKKRDLVALVKVKDESLKARPPIEWLDPQIKGGGRKHKRSERALISRGIMRRDEYIVPGQRAKKNRFGNMSKGQMQKILSDVHARWDRAQNTTKYKRRHYYFAEINGQRGIWCGALDGGESWPILMFVKRPQYRKRFRFYKVANKIQRKRFIPNFRRSLNYALRTAR